MIRARENPVMWQAGGLSVLVHLFFFLLLVMTFSWKSVKPVQISDVELWDSLPPPKSAQQAPKPEPALPKAEPQPEPPPPPPEPKAEIQVKKKPPVEATPPKEKPRPEPKPDPTAKLKEEAKRKEQDLKRLQQLMAQDDQQLTQEAHQQESKSAADARRAAAALAASRGVVDEYKARIVAKIKRQVNTQACGAGKPELAFMIALLPTGEVTGNPRLIKGSGLPACDEAVERAILLAQPLPLPPQPELFAQFRDLSLKFRPNEEQ